MAKRTGLLLGLVPVLLLLFCTSLGAQEIGRGVKVTFLGHAAFKLVSPQGVVVYVDPFLSKNPATPADMKAVDKCDLILVTHGHGDHAGDALAIAQKTGATIVAMAELATHFTRQGAKNVVRMNTGGTWRKGQIAITMVQAMHSSSVVEGEQVVYAGEPVGFVIRFENGFTVYHAGDTGVFGDMKIIGELYKPDLALLPIGSNFTMDPREAAYAAKLLGSAFVIPMHYGTWPLLTGTAEEFVTLMKDQPQTKVLVLKPGQTVQ